VTAAPIVKWAGGKGRLLEQLTPLLPELRERYFEPFLGGAALFFALAPAQSFLSDVNPALVRTYKAVRVDVDDVLAELRLLAIEGTNEKAFYATRDRYNRGGLRDAAHAAAFIYLNRTCFNGLHRVNKRGEFNVPYGRYAAPRIIDEPGLRAASAALARATILQADFAHVIEQARAGDFVYLDPPYVPVSTTASFTAYAKEGFRREDQQRLSNVFRELDSMGCHVMLSNSDSPLVRELYAGFNFDVVHTSRAIACKGESRGRIAELVVRNYETSTLTCEDERCGERGSALAECQRCHARVCPDDVCQHEKRCAYDARNRELWSLDRDTVRL
jgi:DNA adenine methylase